MNERGLPEGIRLAKQVAAVHGCSRSQAEALITAGAVQVDGQVVTDPARRVQEEAQLHVLASNSQLQGPMTLLAHVAEPLPSNAPHGNDMQVLAHLQAMTGTQLPPLARRERLRPVLALQPGQSGLSVWSDDLAVLRRLQDRQQPLEQEWRLSTRVELPASTLAHLRALGWRVSLAQQAPGRLGYRLVSKSAGGPPVPAEDMLELRRLRIGRIGLAPLIAGQARLLRASERF